ncbi:RNA methyltransferase [Candidatus Dojkabacteria bacterium]|uniref:RNA methyltransferase n=1 Tax=Candidatus Dojkabacteria bacterium TaxID=2099670 RepID=A0A955I8D1_9BACT|nr:RNA methyltransferase [Candidatus Dojkabacteria bacterium]
MREVVVVLDSIRSALNVGAIFRTADGAGVKKLYLTGITPYPPHPKVLKTSLGANDYVEFEHNKDINEVIDNLKKEGYSIISLEEHKDAKDFFDVKLPDKCAFVFGNEITGVSNNVIEKSDMLLMLPMRGKKNSLNVATTIGIVLYNSIFSE